MKNSFHDKVIKDLTRMFAVRDGGSKPKKGYILLLSVLMTSIILSISFGVFVLSLKEVVLASFLKDSEISFGAADHALECALYWDREFPENGIVPPESIFATSSTSVPPVNLASASCDGQQLNLLAAPNPWPAASDATHATTTFAIQFSDKTCADVNIVKDPNGTTIVSNGYNNCDASNPRRTQRTIQVTTN